MMMLRLTAEMGESFSHTFQVAQHIARTLDVTVEFTFNGVVMYADGRRSADMALAVYEACLASRIKKHGSDNPTGSPAENQGV